MKISLVSTPLGLHWSPLTMTELSSSMALTASFSTLSTGSEEEEEEEEERDDLLVNVDPLQLQSLMASLDMTSSSSSSSCASDSLLDNMVENESLLDDSVSESSSGAADSSVLVNLTSLIDQSSLESTSVTLHNSEEDEEDNNSLISSSNLSSMLASIHTSSLSSAIVGLFNVSRSGDHVDQQRDLPGVRDNSQWREEKEEHEQRLDRLPDAVDVDDNSMHNVEMGNHRQVRFVDPLPVMTSTRNDVVDEANAIAVNNALINDGDAQAKIGAPPDRLYLAYLTFVVHGVAAVMPWSMLATANPPSTGESFNDVIRYLVSTKLSPSTLLLPPHLPPPDFAGHFLDSLFFTTHVASVSGHVLNVFLRSNGRLGRKLMWTLFLQGVVFLVLILLAMVDTESWTHIFLNLTLYNIAVMSMANGLFSNTMVGIAAKLPPHYLTAFVLGSNLGGTMVSMLRLVSMWMSPDTRTSAIYLFLVALFVSLGCFDSYFALPLNRFVRHYTSLYSDALEEKNELLDSPAIPYCSIFAKCSLSCFSLWLTGLVTRLLHPHVVVEVAKVDTAFVIPDKYFVGIVALLTFHFCAVVGNLIVVVVAQPPGLGLSCTMALLRSLLAPFLVVCNYRPTGVERLWPVLVRSELLFWLANALLAVSDGFCVASLINWCVKSVRPMYACVAAMMGAACLAFGHASGAALAALLPDLVSRQALNFEEPDWWVHSFQG